MFQIRNLIIFILLSSSLIETAISNSVEQSNIYSLESRTVDLDNMIEKNKLGEKGKRIIFEPKLVKFSATIQQLPKKANTDYLLKALTLGGLTEHPTTSHQMFIRSPNNTIIAVYVEDKLAKLILEQLKEEQQWRWQALHSYNNYRGPALLLIGVESLDSEQK